MENPLSVGMIIPYINIYEMENQKKTFQSTNQW
jgi:hypothetical protein